MSNNRVGQNRNNLQQKLSSTNDMITAATEEQTADTLAVQQQKANELY